MKHPLRVLSCVMVLAACNTTPPGEPTRVVPPTAPRPPIPSAAPNAQSPTATASNAPDIVHLGAAIDGPEVALADVAKDPSSFAGHSFTTRGTVTSVCQAMGCWMEIKDASTGAHLRMHGHSFFVPKTASGRSARVQATLVPDGAGKACSDEGECASKNVALLQLDATAVELL